MPTCIIGNGALVSHAFELESEVQALFCGAPAVITFHIPTKAALQEAYSTPILPLDILADRPPVKKFEWVDTLSLIHLVTFLCFYMALWLALTKFSQAKRYLCTVSHRLLAKYGSLISVISIMALFVYLVATSSKSNAAKGGKKKVHVALIIVTGYREEGWRKSKDSRKKCLQHLYLLHVIKFYKYWENALDTRASSLTLERGPLSSKLLKERLPRSSATFHSRAELCGVNSIVWKEKGDGLHYN
ncbi:hypothetical protein HYC85_022114 [Camellia sinensis]|uniref:Uncharacterized protein n=1 Tax=Camellia sinensis TaxID=4442 RepID=A0A7J7GKC1_CAMSI|nr:hypothetical protein HYC85_022114 [Camellia sinensis]